MHDALRESRVHPDFIIFLADYLRVVMWFLYSFRKIFFRDQFEILRESISFTISERHNGVFFFLASVRTVTHILFRLQSYGDRLDSNLQGAHTHKTNKNRTNKSWEQVTLRSLCSFLEKSIGSNSPLSPVSTDTTAAPPYAVQIIRKKHFVEMNRSENLTSWHMAHGIRLYIICIYICIYTYIHIIRIQ